MRYLYFTTQAGLTDPGNTYETIYDSLLNSPKGYEGIGEARLVTKVFDKLELLGEATKRNGQDTFSFKGSPGMIGMVALEDAEYDLVVSVMKSLRWTGAYARKAVQLLEWLEKAPTSLEEARADVPAAG